MFIVNICWYWLGNKFINSTYSVIQCRTFHMCIFFLPILQMKESEEEEMAVNFLELIQSLLKDPEERRDFFLVRQYHLHSRGAKSSFKGYLPL